MTHHRRALFTLPLFITLLCASPYVRAQGESTIAPQKIFAAIGVREGITVCEIGAGTGDLSLQAARIVGSTGRVLTSELGDARVTTLRNRATASGLSHVTVVAGDPNKTNFPDAACDALFMRNVYHHFADPAAMNTSIAASLKPGGKLAIVDFGPPPGKDPAAPADRSKDGTHGITPDALSRELKEAGFEAMATETGAQRWFMVVVAKPAPGAQASQAGTTKDLDQLQGTWTVTAVDGKPVPPGMQVSLVISGDTYQEVRSGGKVTERGTIKLDSSTKPMPLDLLIAEGPYQGKTQLALIDVAGETMTLWLGEPGSTTRPTASSPNKLTLTKVKSPLER